MADIADLAVKLMSFNPASHGSNGFAETCEEISLDGHASSDAAPARFG
jgi:hypothetical protein